MVRTRWKRVEDDNMVSHIALIDGKAYAVISHAVDIIPADTDENPTLWVRPIYPRSYAKFSDAIGLPDNGFGLNCSVETAKKKVSQEIKEYLDEMLKFLVEQTGENDNLEEADSHELIPA